jgi:ribosomal protein S8
MLKNRSIIAPVGSRDTMTRDEALVALDVPLSLSDEFEINEIVPVSKGGKRVIGNIESLPKAKNRRLSDRVRRVA